jgi:hypothetical protein
MARIITSEADVPSGWVRIAEVTDNATDAKIISDAHNADAIPAAKLVRKTSEYRIGPVWVDPAAAKAWLLRCQAKRDAGTPAARSSTEQTIDLTQYEAMRTLQRIETALLRIAEAAEAMATRPG